MIRSEIHDAVAILTLSRPKRRNALSLEMMREILEGLDRIAGSPARVVVIAADGPVFCSGHDLTELTARSEEEYREIFEVCSRLMLRLHELPQPVIAEVQGIATAAGCQLVAACDLAVAADTAKFATPGVRIGLFCTTPMVPLVRAIGRKRAMEMLLTGDFIDAATAVEWGLINRAVPAPGLRDATLELSLKIASASAETLATGKRAFYDHVDRPEPAAYACAAEVMTANSLATDAQEGIAAFLGKRAPVWTR
jgi:enoyl-CoA hydratase/carnithine racemase